MFRAFKAFGIIYLRSWLFLLWSAVCICIGATWMFLAIASVLKAKGLIG